MIYSYFHPLSLHDSLPIFLVALPSFGWALHQATANPEFAYFDTFTRMFEFAVGALVAIVATRLDRMPQWLGASMAWVGLVMILLAGRFFTAEITWPSYNALLPTVGAGMLIAGGVAAGRAGPIRILGNRRSEEHTSELQSLMRNSN